MMDDKNKSLKELMVSNTHYEIKSSYTNIIVSLDIGPNKQIDFELTTGEYSKNDVDLMLNPIIIIELDDLSDLEFDISNIFKYIKLVIGGTRFDKLSNNEIKINQAIYGSSIEINDFNKYNYPIPFGSFNNEFGILVSKCFWHNIKLWIEFTDNPCVSCIKNIKIKTDLIILSDKSNYDKIKKYYVKNIDESEQSNYYKKQLKANNWLDKENSHILKIKQNQYYGGEILIPGLSNQKLRLCFDFIVNEYFIYFENANGSIYKLKPFDTIIFEVDGNIILEYVFKKLCEDNVKNLNYKLPKGIYQINWDKIFTTSMSRVYNFKVEIRGLTIPNDDVKFCMCAISENCQMYLDGMTGTLLST